MEAAFSLSISDFLQMRREEFVGSLTSAHARSGLEQLRRQQTVVWSEQFDLLHGVFGELIDQCNECLEWALVFEYWIPRRQKRPDVVLLADSMIFVIEFKFFAETFTKSAEWQVLDYSLDLRDFHRESAGKTIVPILVATEAAKSDPPPSSTCLSYRNTVLPVQKVVQVDLACRIKKFYSLLHDSTRPRLDFHEWCGSAYQPVLSIIEAAEALFANHTVREIAHATSDNLTQTTDRIVRAIQEAQRDRKRIVCFVTGVPGAGKTLTGLSSVHDPLVRQEGRAASIFLSGNGPLVRIVREALIRNAVTQSSYVSKIEAKRDVSTFVQNVHNFLQEYGVEKTAQAPFENVIVFDEAQRAWDARQVRKKKGIDVSEADLVFQIMERCQDWCVIVALIGGGQEIHDGEGGLLEWGNALKGIKQSWTVLVSPEVFDETSASLSRNRLFKDELDLPNLQVVEEPLLHLAVSVRNLRSQRVAEWVDHVVERETQQARGVISQKIDSAIYLTRDLDQARGWLVERAHGDRRFGLVTSSGNLRARAHGIEVSSNFRGGYRFEEWFLAPPTDVRSSYQMEVAATEFECQGLELDFVCVCWGDDLCVDQDGDWQYRQFRGSAWKAVRSKQAKQNLLNKYRVLLTRAREGMIIWVPRGCEKDATRRSDLLDATFNFLEEAGAVVLRKECDQTGALQPEVKMG